MRHGEINVKEKCEYDIFYNMLPGKVQSCEMNHSHK